MAERQYAVWDEVCICMCLFGTEKKGEEFILE
jgi:hypothetical protein